jgi:hypothetical protein
VFTEKPRSGKKINVPTREIGIGEKRNDRRSDVLQKDEDDESDEYQSLNERLQNLMNRGFDSRRRVVDDLVIHVRWEQGLSVFHRFVDRFRCFKLIGAGEKIDSHRAAGLSI